MLVIVMVLVFVCFRNSKFKPKFFNQNTLKDVCISIVCYYNTFVHQTVVYIFAVYFGICFRVLAPNTSKKNRLKSLISFSDFSFVCLHLPSSAYIQYLVIIAPFFPHWSDEYMFKNAEAFCDESTTASDIFTKRRRRRWWCWRRSLLSIIVFVDYFKNSPLRICVNSILLIRISIEMHII